MNSDTPETDALSDKYAGDPACDDFRYELAALCCRLERERNHYNRTLEKIASARGFDNINGWSRNVAKDALNSLHNNHRTL